MQRGYLSWQLSIRSDGSLPFQGLCPSLIEWQGNLSPAAKMTDLGCRLNTIQIQTTEFDQLNSALSDIGTEKFVQLNQGESNSIAIEFATPRGLVTLN